MDVGALANALRRPGALQTGGGIERASLELKLVISLASAHGARADLLRELRALSGTHEHIRLVQPPGAQARLEAGTHRLPIPGALRDVLLAAAARGADAGRAVAPAVAARLPVAALTSSAVSQATVTPTVAGPISALAANVNATAAATASTAATATVKATTAATNTIAATATALPRGALDLSPALLVLLAGVGPLPRTGRPGAATPVVPLLLAGGLIDDATDTAAASGRLQSAVQHSGLFAEARLARALQDSPRDPAATVLARLPALAQPLELPMAERTAAQLDVLRRDAAVFSLPAWSGQSAQLEIRRERVAGDGHSNSAGGGGDAAAVFSATLRLELPHLGPVAVMLRLANTTLAAIVEANDAAALREALPGLAAQLQARGLQPASLQARTLQDSDEHAA